VQKDFVRDLIMQTSKTRLALHALELSCVFSSFHACASLRQCLPTQTLSGQ
jgi:hypothetical protein